MDSPSLRSCSGLGIPRWGCDPILPNGKIIPASQPCELPHSLRVSSCSSLVFLALSISDQLYFNCFFRPIALQFSCKSHLVLAACPQSFQWLCSHLGIYPPIWFICFFSPKWTHSVSGVFQYCTCNVSFIPLYRVTDGAFLLLHSIPLCVYKYHNSSTYIPILSIGI